MPCLSKLDGLGFCVLQFQRFRESLVDAGQGIDGGNIGVRITIAASTPMIRPIMNPPPMSRLAIALGMTRKAASALKPRKYMTTPPRITKPSTIPNMKPKELIGATQGKNPTHIAKKTGDNSAIPLATMRPAAMKSNAAGNRKCLTKTGRGNGPYQIPPGGGIGVDIPGCIADGIICCITCFGAKGTRLL